jgi:hypothetical protein
MMKGVGQGQLLADKGCKNLYVCNNQMIKKISLDNNAVKNIEFEARFNYKPYKEREYMFNHVWQQVKDKFYEPSLHGVDWEVIAKTTAGSSPTSITNMTSARCSARCSAS